MYNEKLAFCFRLNIPEWIYVLTQSWHQLFHRGKWFSKWRQKMDMIYSCSYFTASEHVSRFYKWVILIDWSNHVTLGGKVPLHLNNIRVCHRTVFTWRLLCVKFFVLLLRESCTVSGHGLSPSLQQSESAANTGTLLQSCQLACWHHAGGYTVNLGDFRGSQGHIILYSTVLLWRDMQWVAEDVLTGRIIECAVRGIK